MIFTRSQLETTLATLVAAVAVLIGVADRIDADDPVYGPKFLGLERIASFNQPVYVAQPPGADFLVVVEKPGRIMAVDDDGGDQRTFLDIRRRVKDRGRGGEQGLLSIAFPPDYRRSGRMYVAFTDRRNALKVVEFRRAQDDADRALRGSARVVLKLPQPTPQHHSGMLLFGPDRRLYVGTGDGGPSGDPRNVAQDRSSLFGKILRIDPRKRGRKPYTIPKDNPYVGRAGRGEVFARGLRNPWRFAFDPVTGEFAVGDVGNARYEEVSQVAGVGKLRGANFGWSAYEGFAAFKGGLPRSATVEPLLAYPHGPACSVTGGPFVRDRRLRRIAGRQVVGAYLFGDFCTGRVFTVRPRPGKRPVERKLRFRIGFLSSFGEDSQRRIYATSLEGPVFRITARRKQIG